MHFSKAITALYFSPAAAVVTRNQRKIMVVRMGGSGEWRQQWRESRSGAVIFLLQGLTIIIFLTMPFVVILLHIASTFLIAVSRREPINIPCPRESFFPALLRRPPSVFVTLLASGQSRTN